MANSTTLTPVCERGTIVRGIPRSPTGANPSVEVCLDQIGTTDHSEIANSGDSEIPLPAVLCERNRRRQGARYPHGNVLQVQERTHRCHPVAVRYRPFRHPTGLVRPHTLSAFGSQGNPNRRLNYVGQSNLKRMATKQMILPHSPGSGRKKGKHPKTRIDGEHLEVLQPSGSRA